MEFRTEILLSPSSHSISWDTPILSLGSCFAGIIGSKLVKHKFQCQANPFGVIYNPISLTKLLQFILNKEYPAEQGYIKHQEVWRHFDFHSDLADLSLENLQKKTHTTIDQLHVFLKDANWLILTMGTAYVYKKQPEEAIVANCHKLPASYFRRELLTPDEIREQLESILNQLLKFNPQLRLIITVSPVRHIRDGLVNNSASKAILRVVCEILQQKYDQVDYFPSYEFMLDDLRDYRFYESDMLHPNSTTETYIWQKFTQKYFTQKTQSLAQEWAKINKALAHKPFFPGSAAHLKFLEQTIEKLNRFKHKVNVDTELESLKHQLNEYKPKT